MPQGSKAKYTSKQKRQAKHIEDSEKKQGRSSKAAARIAYATVNKQDGGGKKAGGSGRGKTSTQSASKKGGKKSSRSTSMAHMGSRKKSSANSRVSHA